MKRPRSFAIISGMDKPRLVSCLEKIDQALCAETTLFVFGAAALILLDEPDRTSLDIDVAAPYSTADFADLERAAAAAGLPINPGEHVPGEYLEWIGPLRLCLPAPDARTDLTLWRGKRLAVKTVSPAGLIASKLIRYDEIDQADILYLCAGGKVEYSAVESAAAALPPAFRDDPVVRENLRNLKADMELWRGGGA